MVLGVCYWYYAFKYRAQIEVETERTATNTDAVYTMEQYLRAMKRNEAIYNYACEPEEKETDYGTYVIPGLKATKTLNTGENAADMCTSMTPQGLAVTEKYILVSAYCKTKQHNSVIYMIDKEKHRFVKEIVLGNRSHVGGMAYDSVNQILWVTGQEDSLAQINAMEMNHLEAYTFDDANKPIEFDMSYDLYRLKRASFMTYHEGALFVGFFTQDNASVIQKYLINEDGTLYEKKDSSLTRATGMDEPVACAVNMQVISGRVQGMAFYNDKILLTRSWGILPSEVQIFHYSPDGILLTEKADKKIKFPERLEQIYQDGEEIYALFESGAYAYRLSSVSRIDRVVKINGKRFGDGYE